MTSTIPAQDSTVGGALIAEEKEKETSYFLLCLGTINTGYGIK